LGAEVLFPFPDGDSGVRLAAVDGEVPAAFCQPDERADVACLEAARPHRVDAGFAKLALAVRQVAKAEYARRRQKPRDVVLEPEDGRPARGAVAADSLEGADAVVQ